ncbi:MAG: cytochrome [Bacillales bacterium]|jgi:menaquinol-cytochrome c reductase cytochrome b/c subunit|nr:cytochrome [Bacillales bacterium]
MKKGKNIKYVGDSRVPQDIDKNIPTDFSQYAGKTEPFYPSFLLKEWMVGAVFLVALLVLSATHAAPLERIADPNDTAYIPLPDWYFLFLYEFLKFPYASGPYLPIGAFVIPGIAFGALFLAPFLDRGPERRPLKRPIATGMMLLAIASIFYLTWYSVEHHDWEATKNQGKIVDIPGEDAPEIDVNADGYKLLVTYACTSCHGDKLNGGAAGPTLINLGLSSDEVTKIVKEGKGAMPPGLFKGTDEELKTLSDYISSLK